MANNNDGDQILHEELFNRHRVIDVTSSTAGGYESYDDEDKGVDNDGFRGHAGHSLVKAINEVHVQHNVFDINEESTARSRLTSVSSSETDRTDMKSAKLDKLKAKMRDKLLLSKTTKIKDSSVARKVNFMESTESIDSDEKILRERLERQKLRRAEMGTAKIFPPTPEEAYDFFTSTWNDDFLKSPEKFKEPEVLFSLPPTSSTQPSTSKETVSVKLGEGLVMTDKSKLLVEDLLELDDHWQLYQYTAAFYRPHQERLLEEDSILYYPSTIKVPVERKLPEQVAPSNLADERVYVGQVPEVFHPRNRNKMEHRLLKNQEMKWFGNDGSILAIPDPTSNIILRPPFSDDDGPNLLSGYQKPVVLDDDHDRFQALNSSAVQLDIDIGQVTFIHHHLFSREHVLATKLIGLCQQFDDRLDKSNIELIRQRLDMLRHELVNVREGLASTCNILNNESDENLDTEEYRSTSDHCQKRLNEYRRDVRCLRQQLDHEERIDRSILRLILRTWRRLRSLRDSQLYANTQVDLKIIKKEVDKDEDLRSWHRALEAELDEEREDFEIIYKLKMKEYETNIVKYCEWKKRNRKVKKKKKKKIEKGLESLTDLPEEESMDEPQQPESFDEPRIKEIILQKALQIRRRPGEPILFPKLLNSNPITPLEQCPSGEQRRRKDVDRSKLFIKVMFNNKKVSQTAIKNLNQDFTTTFGEIFNLRIIHYPHSLTLQIMELSGISTHLVAQVFLPVNEINAIDETCSSDTVDDHEFSCDRVIAHNHDAIGSGFVPSSEDSYLVESKNPDDDSTTAVALLTSGILKSRATWNTDEILLGDGTQSLKSKDNSENKSPKLTGDLTKLRNWLENTTIDQNDPTNANLVDLLETGFTSTLSQDYFILETSENDLDPQRTSWADFFEGRRFRAIRLRNDDVPEFRNLRMIPMRDDDVQLEPFLAYEKRVNEEREPPETVDDDIDSYRRKCSKYIHKMREDIWKRYRYGKRPKELEDVVTEDHIPNIGSLGTTLLNWTDRTRPLRPIRRERKKVFTQGIASGGSSSKVSILVNIANAFNVPVRKEIERTGKQFGIVRQPTTTSLMTINEPLIRPIVEVTFQHSTVRTNASVGSNPCWNQDLQLGFRAPDDNYAPASLQTVKEMIYFNLFDEVIMDILEDDRDRESHVHQRIEKRWLGTLQIQFSTLYINTRIEGTFKVSCPPLLLGYNRDHGNASHQQRSSPFNGLSLIGPLEKDHTYLSIFLILEPVLPLPEPIKENLESNESMELLAKSDHFKRWFLSNFPRRQFKTTVIYVNGKSVFITRFLKELEPPKELIESAGEFVMELLARFVSLIPVVSDIVVFPGICDIWTTNDQFLSVLVGDQQEHAVLLCNYFLYLKKKTWLLLGFAVPDGPSVYVLTQEAMNYTAWNANTGEYFSVQDSFCPIQSVGCLINPENIWVNIQTVSQPSRMSFELNNLKNWRPFFDSKFPNPGLTSIQPEMINYLNTDPTFVDQLREKIEITLRNEIMTWRKRFRTSWNRHCGQVMKKILLKMEQSRIGSFNEDEIQSELYPILNVYKMCGFPLSVAYSEMSTITETVFATGVHLAEGIGVEFALAVHVHGYPHNVIAVWIYVASLHKR